MAIKSDGTLWAWGSNAVGQVGDNTTVIKTIPVQIGTDTNWSYVDAGYNISIAKKTNNSFYTWGWNDSGQLGDNTLINKNVPTQLGTSTNWTNASTGGKFVVALTTDAIFFISIRTWGNNEFGQLGDGTTVNKLVPTSINSCNVLGLDNENLERNSFSVYPNPSSSILNVHNQENLQIDKLTIYDVSGKKILEQSQNLNSINVQNFESGIYFLQITSNNKSTQIKFIKN